RGRRAAEDRRGSRRGARGAAERGGRAAAAGDGQGAAAHEEGQRARAGGTGIGGQAAARVAGGGREALMRGTVVANAPLPGARKAAVLALLLGEEQMAQIFKHLREDEIERITKEVAS